MLGSVVIEKCIYFLLIVIYNVRNAAIIKFFVMFIILYKLINKNNVIFLNC